MGEEVEHSQTERTEQPVVTDSRGDAQRTDAEPSSTGADASAEHAPDAEPSPTAADASAEHAPDAASASGTQAQSEQVGGTETATAAPSADAPDQATDTKPDEAASPAQAATEDKTGEGHKSKRKRRRKKKKSGGDGQGKAAHKESASTPFGRFFAGQGAGRRHAFAVGEIVAGRVETVTPTALVVDLFGRAHAVVSRGEPTTIAAAVAPPEHDTPHADEAELAATPEHEAELAATPEHRAAELVATLKHEAQATAPYDAAMQTGPTPEADSVAAEGATAPVVEGSDAQDAAAADTATTPVVEGSDAQDAAAAQSVVADGAKARRAELEAMELGHSLVQILRDDPAPVQEAAAPALGSVFRGRVGALAESGHVALLNRAADRTTDKLRVELAQLHGEMVEGVVFGFNRGGFDVLVGSLRAFCPASAMSLGPIEDPHHLLGQCLAFRITPPKNQSQTLVVSRRSLLEKHARKAAAARLSSLKEGERLPGKVTAIRDYGILVDVGDVEGLVHLSELSWIRGKKPSEVVTLGEEITVQVLKVQPATRKDRLGKLSLSKRLAEPDPWQNASEGLAPGKAHVGRVVATTEFGAFVEILPGVQGLLHISELGRNLQHANAALAVDAEVGVVVERVDRKQRRLSLSRLSEADMLALQAGELDKVQAAPRIGVTLEVVIEKVEHQGLVVRAQGVLGRRGRGYLPNRELGSDKNAEFRRGLKQGATLQVKVTGTDRDGGFRASLRAREVDEERQAVKAYRKEAAKQGLGTFGDLLRAKLGGQMQAKD